MVADALLHREALIQMQPLRHVAHARECLVHLLGHAVAEQFDGAIDRLLHAEHEPDGGSLA
jgi:hypothetical protein